MKQLSQVMGKSAIMLAIYAMLGTALVAFTFQQTKDAIAKNEENVLLKQINELIPSDKYDNVVYADKKDITDPALGIPTPVTFYRARMKEQPVAIAVTTEAPDGYSGTIKLLIGINYDKTIAGVRVLAHAETPGLGDKIETSKSDWVYSFNGKSLGNPSVDQWKVKKDGGIFDQFSGATITPRAVVGAVRRTLEYFDKNRDEIFK